MTPATNAASLCACPACGARVRPRVGATSARCGRCRAAFTLGPGEAPSPEAPAVSSRDATEPAGRGRPLGSHTQTVRCVRLLRYLEDQPCGRDVAFADLAAHFGVSQKTITRDAAALLAAGEPIDRRRSTVRLRPARELAREPR